MPVGASLMVSSGRSVGQVDLDPTPSPTRPDGEELALTLPFPITPTNYAALSAMITPAIFLTATGSLIISTSNRMSRIIDRIRTLNDVGDALDRGDSKLDFLPERLEHLDDQVVRLEWRSDRVRHTLSMLYIALATFIGTSLTLAVDTLIGNRAITASVATSLSVAGVGLMLLASVNLVREARAALASNHREIRFYRDLRTLRKLQPPNPPAP